MGEGKRFSVRGALDYFVHRDLRGNADSLHRARLLIAIVPLYCAVLLTAAVILVFTDVPLQSLVIAGGICITAAAALIRLLFNLRRTGEYQRYSAMATGITFAAITLGIVASGGVSTSPVAQVMVVPPLMAFFFAGVRGGNRMALITFATVIALLLLELEGIHFPQTITTPGELKIIQYLVIFVAVSTVSGLGLISEVTSAMLKRERDAEHAKVNRLAETDPLTGLANRRKFETVLGKCIAKYDGAPQSHGFSLCYLDLDGFKPINDRYGHDVGDEVLQTVANRLKEVLRSSDVAGRQGGDEFMLIIESAFEATALKDLAQRLIERVSQPIPSSAGPLHISASLGFATFPRDGSTIETLKRSADLAMYEAKRSRRGWSLCCTGEPQTKSA
jgi:diguanylate cyclase (GGDEF)-like protein